MNNKSNYRCTEQTLNSNCVFKSLQYILFFTPLNTINLNSFKLKFGKSHKMVDRSKSFVGKGF